MFWFKQWISVRTFVIYFKPPFTSLCLELNWILSVWLDMLQVGCCTKDLDATWESSVVALVVPLFNPSIGAHGSVAVLEILADGCAFTLDLLATVEVQVARIAVTSLVGIGKAWIEWSGSQLSFNCLWCHFFGLVGCACGRGFSKNIFKWRILF